VPERHLGVLFGQHIGGERPRRAEQLAGRLAENPAAAATLNGPP
jgi:hypothetical protein